MEKLSKLSESHNGESSFKVWITTDKRRTQREDERSEFSHQELGFSLPVNIRDMMETVRRFFGRLFL